MVLTTLELMVVVMVVVVVVTDQGGHRGIDGNVGGKGRSGGWDHGCKHYAVLCRTAAAMAQRTITHRPCAKKICGGHGWTAVTAMIRRSER
jgi:hypothetical protein